LKGKIKRSKEMRGRIFHIAVAMLLIGAFSLTGCRIQPRVRTLPEEIHTVYVPMFLNTSYEPGLEELATRATVEAFLADGRLDVVTPANADVVVQGTILDFNDDMTADESDHFPLINTMKVNVKVNLYSPKDRLHPIMEYKPLTVTTSYVSDTRRVTMTIPEDARQTLMDGMGRQVVLEVLTGEYTKPAEEKKPK